jgi:hypothetical protein
LAHVARSKLEWRRLRRWWDSEGGKAARDTYQPLHNRRLDVDTDSDKAEE